MEITDVYPNLGASFDYSAKERQQPAGSGEKVEEKLLSVMIQFPELAHPVVIAWDPEVAKEIRKDQPDAAFWSADAFERFLEDIKRLPPAERRQYLIGVNQVKAILGGSYKGFVAGPC